MNGLEAAFHNLPVVCQGTLILVASVVLAAFLTAFIEEIVLVLDDGGE